jgi:predicted DsbA family dithiol-disulfide isomerase
MPSSRVGRAALSGPVVHWFDFVCPFCYVGQSRNAILHERGVVTVDRGMRIHPEIGPGGRDAGERVGPMYDALRREAERVRLPLVWRAKIAYSRPALTLYSWLQLNAPAVAPRFMALVFRTYFGEGRDIEPEETLIALLEEAAEPGRIALPDGWRDDGFALLRESEAVAEQLGVRGTPAWVSADDMVIGLRPSAFFEEWARELAGEIESGVGITAP